MLDLEAVGFVLPSLEAAGSVSPDLEATDFISPDPLGAVFVAGWGYIYLSLSFPTVTNQLSSSSLEHA